MMRLHIPVNPSRESDPSLPPIPIETRSPILIRSSRFGACIPLGHWLIRCLRTARSRRSLIPSMLSKHTLKLLDELCAKSKDQYPEGGILWTFVEAASQAHFRFKDARREPQAGAMELKQLAAWVQGALGGANNPQESVAAVSTSIANELVRALKDDLQVDEFLWAFEDGGGDMTGNIYMARNFDNRYFALEMWWSVD